MRRQAIFLLTFGILFALPCYLSAQRSPVPARTIASEPAPKDTVREFEIIRGPSMRMIQTDTGTLQIIAGGAIVNQGRTRFTADSIVLNTESRNMESFGKVHINDGDTVNIYAQYLRYNGFQKYAFLRRSVRLIGKNGNLTTEEMDYNLNSGIANYYKGGKIINKKNVVTSQRGTYYADTRDVYFKQNVKMDGPKDHIRSDSLIYNMNDGGITFVSDTYVRNDEVEIRTTEGRYDTNTGDAFFSSRTNVKDSSGRIYVANNMALEGESGNAQLEGNAVIIDSANGFNLIANQVFLNNKENSFFATKKPVLTIKEKNDSVYIAAEVIYSGVSQLSEMSLRIPEDVDTSALLTEMPEIDPDETDTSRTEILDKKATPGAQPIIDSLPAKPADSTISEPLSINRTIDSAAEKKDTIPQPGELPIADTMRVKPATDSLDLHETKPHTTADSLKPRLYSDTIPKVSVVSDSLPADSTLKSDTLTVPDVSDSLSRGSDSARYFIAYHNVRIYNDSLQGVCDSLFISSRDSVFRLYRDPVLWSGETQVTGDTMFLFTKNKEAERLYVFDQSIVVNRTKEGFFNQMAGKTLNAYFKNNKFDLIRLRGSQSESIYFLQDEDSAYIGMNRATGDVIDMIFNNGELLKVLLINEVKGVMHPMGQIPEDQRFLKNYQWLNERRPKNRAELFQ